MNELSIARRYARALYEQALAEKAVAPLDEDVELIGRALEDSRDLRRLFESPIVPREKKVAVVRGLFGARVQPVMLRFLELLIEKNREQIFPAVVTAYRQQRDREQGITEAEVRVAAPLDDAAREQMRQRLEVMTGKKVRLKVRHEPALLGGVVIRLGDTVYDGSVRNKLVLLRDQMEHGQFSMN